MIEISCITMKWLLLSFAFFTSAKHTLPSKRNEKCRKLSGVFTAVRDIENIRKAAESGVERILSSLAIYQWRQRSATRRVREIIRALIIFA